MDLWRLTLHSKLDGEGGRLYSARWNTAGAPIVYLADSPPGALIEILVHLELEESELPPTFTLLHIAVPDRLKITTLPIPTGEAWKTDELITRKIGDVWLKSKKSALARVPSSILPATFNYLFNPLHPDATRVTIVETQKAILNSA